MRTISSVVRATVNQKVGSNPTWFITNSCSWLRMNVLCVIFTVLLLFFAFTLHFAFLVSEIISLNRSIEQLKNEKVELSESVQEIELKRLEEEKGMRECKEQYNKLKVLLEQKGYARKRRENKPTDEAMIKDSASSARYRRRIESKNIMEFIHGGKRVVCMVHGTYSSPLHQKMKLKI